MTFQPSLSAAPVIAATDPAAIAARQLAEAAEHTQDQRRQDAQQMTRDMLRAICRAAIKGGHFGPFAPTLTDLVATPRAYLEDAYTAFVWPPRTASTTTAPQIAAAPAVDIATAIQAAIQAAIGNTQAPTQALDVDAVREIAAAVVADAISDTRRPVQINVNGSPVATTAAGDHPIVAEVLHAVSVAANQGMRRLNFDLVGPTGTGKSVAARAVAKALTATFVEVACSATTTASRLLWQATVSGQYVAGAVARHYGNEAPTVICLDEFDSLDPAEALSLNQALGATQIYSPTGDEVQRGAMVVILRCLNTWGSGPTAQYCGRNAQDAASMDRALLRFYVDYDQQIDRSILADDGLRATIQGMRAAITQHGIRQALSYRAMETAALLLAMDTPTREIPARLTMHWTADERRRAGVPS